MKRLAERLRNALTNISHLVAIGWWFALFTRQQQAFTALATVPDDRDTLPDLSDEETTLPRIKAAPVAKVTGLEDLDEIWSEP